MSNAAPKNKGSALYKRPSIAIEKGGGFYIPGLEGPRLRLAVSALALCLLAANHSSRQLALNQSALVSEALAITAACTLGAFAWRESVSAATSKKAVARLSKAARGGSQQLESNHESENARGLQGTGANLPVGNAAQSSAGKFGQDMSWLVDTVVELTAAETCVVLRGTEVMSFAGNVSLLCSGSSANVGYRGAVVERVAEEQKALYINDLSTLPRGIDIPFLNSDRTASLGAFVVPLPREFILIAVAPLTEQPSDSPASAAADVNSASQTMGPRERLWIQSVAESLTLE